MNRQKTMWRKFLALGLAGVMTAVAAGCGSSHADTTKGDAAVERETTTAAATQDENSTTDDIVTLKWVACGTGMPQNYDAWEKQVNDYIGPKIGVNIKMEIVPWGDWDSRRSVLVNTSGDYDIIFTNGITYYNDVKTGALTNITDLIQTASPKLYEMIPEMYINAVRVDGEIYAVPTYKDSSQSIFAVWDKELCDKNGIDPSQFTELDQMTEALGVLRDATGEAPFVLNKNGGNYLYITYDNLGAGLIPMGVKIDDKNAKVVSVFEQDDMMNYLRLFHQWYKDGIINADAATRPEDSSYIAVACYQGWASAAKTTWGPSRGVECVAYQWGPTVCANDTVRGSMNGISSNCKYPEKALQLLELVNTDSHLRDMFFYGEEGTDWEYTDDKLVHTNTTWSMAGYTQATFFTVTQKDDVDFNQWDDVKALNEKAVPSVLLGFTYDPSKVSDELADCITIYTQYKSEILTGTVDPDEAIPQMIAEMNAAGFKDLMEDAQAQVDKFMASK